MNDQEAVQMMKRSSDEIKSLRGQIAALAPKAQAYEMIAAILRLLPQQSQGYGEDVAWMLDKRIKELLSSTVSEEVAS